MKRIPPILIQTNQQFLLLTSCRPDLVVVNLEKPYSNLGSKNFFSKYFPFISRNPRPVLGTGNVILQTEMELFYTLDQKASFYFYFLSLPRTQKSVLEAGI